MTPKQQAKKLVNKFYVILMKKNYPNVAQMDAAKECAIVAVDEIIVELESVEFNYNIKSSLPSEFWQEVKQEIEKL